MGRGMERGGTVRAGGSRGRSGVGLAGAQGMVSIERAVASAGVGARGAGTGGAGTSSVGVGGRRGVGTLAPWSLPSSRGLGTGAAWGWGPLPPSLERDRPFSTVPTSSRLEGQRALVSEPPGAVAAVSTCPWALPSSSAGGVEARARLRCVALPCGGSQSHSGSWLSRQCQQALRGANLGRRRVAWSSCACRDGVPDGYAAAAGGGAAMATEPRWRPGAGLAALRGAD